MDVFRLVFDKDMEPENVLIIFDDKIHVYFRSRHFEFTIGNIGMMFQNSYLNDDDVIFHFSSGFVFNEVVMYHGVTQEKLYIHLHLTNKISKELELKIREWKKKI